MSFFESWQVGSLHRWGALNPYRARGRFLHRYRVRENYIYFYTDIIWNPLRVMWCMHDAIIQQTRGWRWGLCHTLIGVRFLNGISAHVQEQQTIDYFHSSINWKKCQMRIVPHTVFRSNLPAQNVGWKCKWIAKNVLWCQTVQTLLGVLIVTKFILTEKKIGEPTASTYTCSAYS